MVASGWVPAPRGSHFHPSLRRASLRRAEMATAPPFWYKVRKEIVLN